MKAGARCPICAAAVPADGRWRPFCSDRCRLVDLGRWFGGDYRVPGPADEPDPAPPAATEKADDDRD